MLTGRKKGVVNVCVRGYARVCVHVRVSCVCLRARVLECVLTSLLF